jgi:hypothetical protein
MPSPSRFRETKPLAAFSEHREFGRPWKYAYVGHGVAGWGEGVGVVHLGSPIGLEIGVERPILHVELDLGRGWRLHAVDVNLKSRIPTEVPGQKVNDFTWRTADVWAEESFIWSVKRMSQALEVRRLVDRMLAGDP